MIRIYKYLELGVALIDSNEWEVLLVLDRLGYATVGPHHWVSLTIVDRIVQGRYKGWSKIILTNYFSSEARHLRSHGPCNCFEQT